MAAIVIASGHAKPPPPVDWSPPAKMDQAASRTWVRLISEAVGNVIYGNLNAVTDATLVANNIHTTVSWPRINPYCGLFFCPLTANAAAEMGNGTLWVSALTNGSAQLTHANNAQADRTYRVLIIG